MVLHRLDGDEESIMVMLKVMSVTVMPVIAIIMIMLVVTRC
jgi:hypothetical protein